MRLLATFLGVSLVAAAHPQHAAHRMVETAKNFLASLSDDQKAKAVFPLEGEERSFWEYIPTDDIPKRHNRPRRGLMIREMTATQKHLAAALLSSGLSQQGYIKATTIMSLEEILKVIEGDTKERRDPEKYHFSIFGEPSAKGAWAYRIEGHHVSLHFTVAGGNATGNPTFFGSNPAEVRSGPRQGLRVLGAEEDKARALMNALTPNQRKQVVVDEKAYSDVLTTNSRKAALEGKPGGLPASAMTPEQRKLLDELISEYVENVTGELAEQRRARVKEAGSKLWFAWAGVIERGGPHYYRVQSPTFLIEYDNTQNNANHVHSVWRDFEGDFGLDLLKLHYQTSSKEHGHDSVAKH